MGVVRKYEIVFWRLLMFKMIKLAWRNIWRNWRRTGIATIAIVLGLLLLVFMDGLYGGYDEDDYLVNTMLGKNVKNMDGKMLASRLEVIPADEEGNKTILEYLWIKFDEPIADNFFSVQNMKRIQ